MRMQRSPRLSRAAWGSEIRGADSLIRAARLHHTTRNKKKNMIIWSGFGFLPIAFLIVFGLGFANHTGPITDSELAYTLLMTGIASGALGWWFSKRPARIVVDKATGKEIALRPRHSLFFIPMFYWGPIFIAM